MTRLATVIGAATALIACSGAKPAQVNSPAEGEGAVEGGVTEPGAAGASADAGLLEETAESPGNSGAEIDAPEFRDNDTKTRGLDEGVKPSAIEPTVTEAALKFTVIDKGKGAAIPGIVIKLTGPDGSVYYTEETDAKGYAEVLVPVDTTYEVVFLSLGRKKIAAKLPVDGKPNQTQRLVLRYKGYDPDEGKEQGLVLEGVRFDSGKATLRPESYPKLDRVVEYMKHNKSVQIEISGHTDNVGNPKRNKALSKKRAKACRKYLISNGIAGGRIEAVGYGEERPIAPNDTEEGRQKNRRIEAIEL